MSLALPGTDIVIVTGLRRRNS
jgi:hypothetical protein